MSAAASLPRATLDVGRMVDLLREGAEKLRPSEPGRAALVAGLADDIEKIEREPAPARPSIAELLEGFRHYVMTPEEREAQKRSWVVGELLLANPGMTRAQAEARYDDARRQYGDGR